MKHTIYYIMTTLATVTTRIPFSYGAEIRDAYEDRLKDSISMKTTGNEYNIHYRRLIVPTVFMGYGAMSLTSNSLRQLNISTRDEINKHNPWRTTLDNYTQYAPAVIVYAFNAAGVKGKHNFSDRTILYTTAQLLTASFALPLKHILREDRPDRSNRLSFPSGHAATAFSSAHFMFREFEDTNFWLGASAYSFAAFTGIYRIINNKHWVSDVVAGAGFGILSTEIAYWCYPKISELLSNKKQASMTMILPGYQNRTLSLGLVKNF